MDSLTRKFKQPIIPASKTLQSGVIKEYQCNLRKFLLQVEQQVSLLIRKYENQILSLKKQNNILKSKLERIQKFSSFNPQQIPLKTNEFPKISPIKKQNRQFSVTNDRFNFFPTSPKQQLILNQNSVSSNCLQFFGEDISSSRFQIQKNSKKLKQQQLLNSLVSGKNNMSENTTKLMDLIGKNKKEQKKQQSLEQQQRQIKSTDEQKQGLNTSLSIVCQSLDNSFHGKKSKKKNELKRKQKQELRKNKIQQAKKYYNDRKQHGLKNLLKSFRQNLSSTQTKPVQILKNVKVANSGYDNDDNYDNDDEIRQLKKDKNNSSKSKVLIDPNPIDITKKRPNNTINQTQKKLHSILKQTSTILSKSLLSNCSFVN